MRKTLSALVLLLAANVSSAATRNCTSGLVTQGVCRVNTNRLLSYDLPPAAAADLADAIAAQLGCATVQATPATCTVTCTQPLVSPGVCTVADRDARTTVTVTKASFADAMLRWDLLSRIKQWKEDEAVRPARDTARAQADPDIGN